MQAKSTCSGGRNYRWTKIGILLSIWAIFGVMLPYYPATAVSAISPETQVKNQVLQPCDTPAATGAFRVYLPFVQGAANITSNTNRAPVVTHCSLVLPPATAITIDLRNVVMDPDGDILSFVIKQATAGTVNLVGTLLDYTPSRATTVEDVIGYAARDGKGGLLEGTLTVTIDRSMPSPSPSATSTPPATNPLLTLTPLVTTLVGIPVNAGSYIFWADRRDITDTRDLRTKIRGYDLSHRTEFEVTPAYAERRYLVSDGTTLAWTENEGGQLDRIVGYDIATRTAFTIFAAAVAPDVSGMALDQGVLYYADARTEHRGVFARQLTTGQEQRISNSPGRNFVARNGHLLWSTDEYQGKYTPMQISLHLYRAGSGASETVIVQSPGLQGYAVSQNAVVWATDLPDTIRGVTYYRIDTSTRTQIYTGAAQDPIIDGNRIAWIVPPGDNPSLPSSWKIKLYTFSTNANTSSLNEITGTTTTIVDGATAMIETHGFTSDNALIVRSHSTPSTGMQHLLLIGLQSAPYGCSDGVQSLCEELCAAGAIVFCTAAPPPPDPLEVDPLQVRQQGSLLMAPGFLGRFPVNGTHFLLPSEDINSYSFYDIIYNNPMKVAERDKYLGLAKSLLNPQTLRIFVEMPYRTPTDQLIVKTSVETIYQFSLLAEARGMRLGIVVHNQDVAQYGKFLEFTPDRRNWLLQLRDIFRARGARHNIAYISASNEINEPGYCGRTTDCFDNNSAYVDQAVNFVASVAAVFAADRILTTVGMTTEAPDADGRLAGDNFFKRGFGARSLANVVNFVSPHNYAGNARNTAIAIRDANAYGAPIVMEEYGYPTDPVSRDPTFTEFPDICRQNLFLNFEIRPECVDTAPGKIEANIRQINNSGYAGSSAFMVADIQFTSTDERACGKPRSEPDFYDGLITSKTTYCGGTYMPPGYEQGVRKSTGDRVFNNHLFRIFLP